MKKCSFCKSNTEDAGQVVVTPDKNACICAECIRLCIHAIDVDSSSDIEIKKISKKSKSKSSKKIKPCLLPHQIVDKLNEFIIGQDEAKKILSVAVYNHYKRLQNIEENGELEIEKSNILMLGPTGCGKTLLAKTLAKILDVPFAIADATSLTEAGYVGDDVENILMYLIQNADYDVEKAQKGIIYIDEIDKIVKKTTGTSITRDVSGEGVQQALLKIIEGTVANVSPNSSRKNPQDRMIKIDTSNILFICGGAFVNLDKTIESRLDKSSIGFNKPKMDSKNTENKSFYEIAKQVNTQDLINYGLIPEFVSRLPITIVLHELDESAIVKILTETKNSITKQYIKLFAMDNVELKFENESIVAIAKKTIEQKTGARGLRSIIEKTLLDFMYTIPQNNEIKEIMIDAKKV
ncbi:ATP-dependent Clp protease ATP-binding subunit ClpX-like [Triplophysa rosa]|uniref:ATP-dependent Clp protease ATP-binding subunit ClpX-like n=1 Tax=Triplophysa rosa TaxID=992332 RepID=UPI00254618E1|nr:ATP-dependent Clp protease ATP-binding subunit ClpX-like [Triplophysa rosa]